MRGKSAESVIPSTEHSPRACAKSKLEFETPPPIDQCPQASRAHESSQNSVKLENLAASKVPQKSKPWQTLRTDAFAAQAQRFTRLPNLARLLNGRAAIGFAVGSVARHENIESSDIEFGMIIDADEFDDPQFTRQIQKALATDIPDLSFDEEFNLTSHIYRLGDATPLPQNLSKDILWKLQDATLLFSENANDEKVAIAFNTFQNAIITQLKAATQALLSSANLYLTGAAFNLSDSLDGKVLDSLGNTLDAEAICALDDKTFIQLLTSPQAGSYHTSTGQGLLSDIDPKHSVYRIVHTTISQAYLEMMASRTTHQPTPQHFTWQSSSSARCEQIKRGAPELLPTISARTIEGSIRLRMRAEAIQTTQTTQSDQKKTDTKMPDKSPAFELSTSEIQALLVARDHLKAVLT